MTVYGHTNIVENYIGIYKEEKQIGILSREKWKEKKDPLILCL